MIFFEEMTCVQTKRYLNPISGLLYRFLFASMLTVLIAPHTLGATDYCSIEKHVKFGGPSHYQIQYIGHNFPEKVRPGQEVTLVIRYQTLKNANPTAIIYHNIFGSWNPDAPLAWIKNGTLQGRGKFIKILKITAPKEPGAHTLRLIFAASYTPFINYYGEKDDGLTPTLWTSIQFKVIADRLEPPLNSEKFLSDCTKTTSTQVAEAQNLCKKSLMLPTNGHTLSKEGGAYPQVVKTQSGKQLFVLNDGFKRSANFKKLFAKRPTTLWNDERRKACYEKSVRLIAQMPMAKGVDVAEEVHKMLEYIGFGVTRLSMVSQAIHSINTNYIGYSGVAAFLPSKLNLYLQSDRYANIAGKRFEMVNLKNFSKALKRVAIATKVVDFAVGASFQESFAGDVAIWRINCIKHLMMQRFTAGEKVDPMIFDALPIARNNLIRSEDYWAALIVELNDRKNELAGMGLDVAVDMVKKKPIQLMTKYYQNIGMTKKAASAKATTVAGLWAFSLMATYETIDSLLEQHEIGQKAVTSATLAYLINEEVKAKRARPTPVIMNMKFQAEYDYYDQMIKISSGVIPGFHDLLSKGRHYKESKIYFKGLKERVEEQFIQTALSRTLAFK